MARTRKYDIDKEATELLGLTLRAAKQKLKTFEDEGLPVDAASISANVSLLKLVDAFNAAKADDKAVELEKLRQEFQSKASARSVRSAAPSRPEPDPAELRRQYGLEDE